MKSTHLISFLLAGVVFVASTPASAGQRTRNPGGDSGGSAGSSGGSSGGSTGSVAVPRDGGSAPWGGGSVSTRPSEPTSSSSGGRRPARVSGGSGVGSGGSTVPPYSRRRNGAPITGYGVERGTVATLPPIVSGPIYWGSDDWYFYPWGYGALALGYFWDPWMWGGYYGGWGGYPYVDAYGGGGGGYGGWDNTAGGTSTPSQEPANPLDPNLPTGSIRLKVEPRDAEVLVDGFYAGRVDDFDGARQKLNITRGVHRIELRAPGYETATFNVTIVVGETTTYKTELKRQ
jgi:hypothetical protein